MDTAFVRADELTFEELFRVEGSTGRICLGADRYVMLDADALGSMRKELIDNLGCAVARGVLERVGYQSGRNDARRLRAGYRWLSDEEWLRAGPRLHYLEGIVRVRVHTLEVDRSQGRFSMVGEWLDSYEADQHLKHYGAADQPACWTLEGYATGYATEFFGREVICMETSCRAKGDPTCGFELRPAQEWGLRVHPVHEMLAAVRFTERFDRCLRAMNRMGCELEQTALDAVITTDRRGRVASCSQAGTELLGLPAREVVGRHISSFYAGGLDEARLLMARLEAEGRIRNYVTELLTSDGTRVPVALSGSIIRNAEGEIAGTLGIAHNLSEIRRLEDELAAQNRFMANILQDSAEAILTLDPDDVILSWNRGAEQIFGYTSREAVGRHVDLIVPPELRDARELARIAEKVRAQGSVRSYQTERVTRDGRRIRVVFTRTAIFDEAGRFAGSSAVVKDVTSVLALERQLAYSEHLANLGELAAGLAHEIKNPLAGIQGAIDVIRDSFQAADPHRAILGDVLHEVDRIDHTVRDLLSYAKPRTMQPAAVCLPEVAQRLVAMVRNSSNNELLSIRLRVEGEVPSFTGDESQLEQVLLNLLLNAQKAMPSGGAIDVLLGYDPSEWTIRVEVRDSGPGIAEEIRGRIFQPFFTTRTDGTGLGLATCSRNVRYHGGSIEVCSEPGRGARFIVLLPLLCRL